MSEGLIGIPDLSTLKLHEVTSETPDGLTVGTGTDIGTDVVAEKRQGRRVAEQSLHDLEDQITTLTEQLATSPSHQQKERIERKLARIQEVIAHRQERADVLEKSELNRLANEISNMTGEKVTFESQKSAKIQELAELKQLQGEYEARLRTAEKKLGLKENAKALWERIRHKNKEARKIAIEKAAVKALAGDRGLTEDAAAVVYAEELAKVNGDTKERIAAEITDLDTRIEGHAQQLAALSETRTLRQQELAKLKAKLEKLHAFEDRRKGEQATEEGTLTSLQTQIEEAQAKIADAQTAVQHAEDAEREHWKALNEELVGGYNAEMLKRQQEDDQQKAQQGETDRQRAARERVAAMPLREEHLRQITHELGRDADGNRDTIRVISDLNEIVDRQVAKLRRIKDVADERHGSVYGVFRENMRNISEESAADAAARRAELRNEMGVLSEEQLQDKVRQVVEERLNAPEVLSTQNRLRAAEALLQEYSDPMYQSPKMRETVADEIAQAERERDNAKANLALVQRELFGTADSGRDLARVSTLEGLEALRGRKDLGEVERLIVDNAIREQLAEQKYLAWYEDVHAKKVKEAKRVEVAERSEDSARFIDLSPEDIALVTSGEYLRGLSEAELVKNQLEKWLNVIDPEKRKAIIQELVMVREAQDELDVRTATQLAQAEARYAAITSPVNHPLHVVLNEDANAAREMVMHAADDGADLHGYATPGELRAAVVKYIRGAMENTLAGKYLEDIEKLSKERPARRSAALLEVRKSLLPEELVSENPAEANFLDFGGNPTVVGELYDLAVRGGAMLRTETDPFASEPVAVRERVRGVFVEVGGPRAIDKAVEEAYAESQRKKAAEVAEGGKEKEGNLNERLGKRLKENWEATKAELLGAKNEEIANLSVEVAGALAETSMAHLTRTLSDAMMELAVGKDANAKVEAIRLVAVAKKVLELVGANPERFAEIKKTLGYAEKLLA